MIYRHTCTKTGDLSPIVAFAQWVKLMSLPPKRFSEFCYKTSKKFTIIYNQVSPFLFTNFIFAS